MDFQAVIFDMDGLMFDTESAALTAWRETMKRMGASVSEDVILQTAGLNGVQSKALLARHVPGLDAERAREIWYEIFDGILAENGVPVKPGLYALLDALKAAGVRRAVATGTRHEKAWSHLRSAGVEAAFDAVCTGDMVSRGKPAPDLFLKAAEMLGTEPKDCIVLEDSAYGIAAAQAAGMRAIMVPDQVPPAEGMALYGVCRDLNEVIKFLKLA